MRVISFLMFICCFSVHAQEFPEGWIGAYEGKMMISGKKANHSVKIQLSITAIRPDTSWTYTMTYFSSTGNIVKDYKIVRKSVNEFIMDEGDIEIPMRYSNGCFYDFYVIDSIYYTSVLSKSGKNLLEFNLYGGSLDISNRTTTRESDFNVNSYSPAFSQRAILKRKKR